eukprot:2575228-Prymnesium_polylepis.1
MPGSSTTSVLGCGGGVPVSAHAPSSSDQNVAVTASAPSPNEAVHEPRGSNAWRRRRGSTDARARCACDHACGPAAARRFIERGGGAPGRGGRPAEGPASWRRRRGRTAATGRSRRRWRGSSRAPDRGESGHRVRAQGQAQGYSAERGTGSGYRVQRVERAAGQRARAVSPREHLLSGRRAPVGRRRLSRDLRPRRRRAQPVAVEERLLEGAAADGRAGAQSRQQHERGHAEDGSGEVEGGEVVDGPVGGDVRLDRLAKVEPRDEERDERRRAGEHEHAGADADARDRRDR